MENIVFSTFPVSHLDFRWPKLALNWRMLAEASFKLDHIGRKLVQVGPNWSQVGPSCPKVAALVRSDLKMCFLPRQGAHKKSRDPQRQSTREPPGSHQGATGYHTFGIHSSQCPSKKISRIKHRRRQRPNGYGTRDDDRI